MQREEHLDGKYYQQVVRVVIKKIVYRSNEEFW